MILCRIHFLQQSNRFFSNLKHPASRGNSCKVDSLRVDRFYLFLRRTWLSYCREFSIGEQIPFLRVVLRYIWPLSFLLVCILRIYGEGVRVYSYYSQLKEVSAHQKSLPNEKIGLLIFVAVAHGLDQWCGEVFCSSANLTLFWRKVNNFLVIPKKIFTSKPTKPFLAFAWNNDNF